MVFNYTVATAPTDVRAAQTSPDTVCVSWTPPSVSPVAGYQVQVAMGNTTTTTDVTGTSHTISVNNQFGVYSILVRSLSQHLPSEATAPVQVTVRGKEQYIPYYSIPVTNCAI